jgi:hypothetical protein
VASPVRAATSSISARLTNTRRVKVSWGTWLDAPVTRLDHSRYGDPRMAAGNRDERDFPSSDAM